MSVNSECVGNELHPWKYRQLLERADGAISIDNGTKMFWLDQATGKSCFILSPRDLSITWGNDKRYWHWISQNDSSFMELAKLSAVCWFEVRGQFDSKFLSPCTAYTVSFILKLQDPYGWDNQPVKFEITTCSGYHKVSARFLENTKRLADDFGYEMASIRHLADGWIEFDAGEFVVAENDGCPKKVSFCMREWEGGNWKGGLLLGGVKIQPSIVVEERKTSGLDSTGSRTF